MNFPFFSHPALNLGLFGSTFLLIFLAELPDKTALAIILMASRYKPVGCLCGCGGRLRGSKPGGRFFRRTYRPPSALLRSRQRGDLVFNLRLPDLAPSRGIEREIHPETDFSKNSGLFFHGNFYRRVGRPDPTGGGNTHRPMAEGFLDHLPRLDPGPLDLFRPHDLDRAQGPKTVQPGSASKVRGPGLFVGGIPVIGRVIGTNNAFSPQPFYLAGKKPFWVIYSSFPGLLGKEPTRLWLNWIERLTTDQ